MKKIGWRAFALFVIAFTVTLVITAPATLLARMVEAGSNGQFVLANATGTLWRGNATPAIRQRSGSLLAHYEGSLRSAMALLNRGTRPLPIRTNPH